MDSLKKKRKSNLPTSKFYLVSNRISDTLRAICGMSILVYFKIRSSRLPVLLTFVLIKIYIFNN